MKIKKLFKWGRQKNGKYSIFGVPILKPFSRSIGNKKYVVNESMLSKSVEKFQDQKAQGYYPRVHIEHQKDDGISNAKGIGFLDNMRMQGNQIVADLVEIDQKDIDSIKSLQYPNRSVEYNADTGVVESLALLDSRPPFFRFSILALENEPSMVNEKEKDIYFQDISIDRYKCLEEELIEVESSPILFQDWDAKNKKDFYEREILFQNNEYENEKETIQMDEEENIDLEATETGEIGENQETQITQDNDSDSRIEKKIDSMAAVLQVIAEAILNQGGGETESEEEPEDIDSDYEEEPEETSETEKNKANSSVAMQSLERRIKRLEAEKTEIKLQAELDDVCSRLGLSVREERNNILAFSNVRDRKNYLEILKKRASTGRHRLGTIGMSSQMSKIESRARKDYRDTIMMQDENASNLKKRFGSENDYVQFVVDREKIMPGSYDEMMKGN